MGPFYQIPLNCLAAIAIHNVPHLRKAGGREIKGLQVRKKRFCPMSLINRVEIQK